MRPALISVLVFVLCGCATSRGFDRGALRTQTSEQRMIAEEDIAKVLALKPQLPRGFKLGIYLVPPEPGQLPYTPEWNWTGEDKDELLKMAAPLKEKGIVADAYIVPESLLDGRSRRAVRLAAARSGADAVLIVGGVPAIDRYNNELGYTYVLLLTALVVPGTVADGLFITNASMWDVGNDYLYLSVEAEGVASQTAAPVFIAEERIIKRAKAEAVQELQKDVTARLIRMEAG